MSYLLFMDESGQDGKEAPYEVRGGIAIEDNKIWSCINDLRVAEKFAFGDNLVYRTNSDGKRMEFKGKKHLTNRIFKKAEFAERFDDTTRQQLCTSLLDGINGSKDAVAAYAQGCLIFAREIFKILKRYDALIFASAIQGGIKKPQGYANHDYLRKDHIYLLERYYYFLEERQSIGILVMDETEVLADVHFLRTLERYFIKTENGRQRSTRIVPVPLFVDSASSYLIQAADICIYCINWCFRLPSKNMNAPIRDNLKELIGSSLYDLQYKKEYDGDFASYGIFFVENPYEGRR